MVSRQLRFFKSIITLHLIYSHSYLGGIQGVEGDSANPLGKKVAEYLGPLLGHARVEFEALGVNTRFVRALYLL